MVNGVSSTTPQTTPTANDTSLAGNYTTFLNLLTAQIKNQDPLSPMDTTQWTNQLVQYSSVEQQLKANQYLASLVAGSTQSNMNAAVGYIGKSVMADQDISQLQDGHTDWQYALGSDANKVTLTVANEAGDIVWSGDADAAEMGKGLHSFSWDGKNSAGQLQPDGSYTLSVKAANVAGDVNAAVGISGTVTSAANIDGTVILKVGNTSVPLSAITSVT
ncbi:MAG: flagellar hook capping FlgD N-terminal domain-containing protein [Asticcacaulis sp.]